MQSKDNGGATKEINGDGKEIDLLLSPYSHSMCVCFLSQ